MGEVAAKMLPNQLVAQLADPGISPFLEEWRHSTPHPIFKKNQWRALSDTDYLLCRPAIALASRLLTCGRALHFWHAFLLGNQELHRDRHGMERVRFSPVYDVQSPLPSAVKRKVLNALEEMSFSIKLQFAETGSNEGMCIPVLSPQQTPVSFSTTTTATRSFISISYKALLRMKSAPSGIATLRHWFRFAVTLVHEAAHAVAFAKDGIGDEGVFGDQIFSEMGFAIVKWIFNGRPYIARLRPSGEEILASYQIPHLGMVKTYRQQGLFPLLGDVGAESEVVGIVDDTWLKHIFFLLDEAEPSSRGVQILTTPCRCEQCNMITRKAIDSTRISGTAKSADVKSGTNAFDCVEHTVIPPDEDGGCGAEHTQWLLSLSDQRLASLQDNNLKAEVLEARAKYARYNKG